jgi:prolyl-tRNA synthetase
MSRLVPVVQKLVEKVKQELWQKALRWMKDHVYRVESLEETKQLLQKRAGIVEVLWCNRAECGHRLEEEVDARVLGVPVDIEEKVDGKCVVCGQKAEHVVRVAVAY